MTNPSEVWAAGNAYEPYIGRWSRPIARDFLVWLAAPADARWFDVGCGTGALTATILACAAPAHVCSVDRSFAYAAFARNTLADARVAFAVADAQKLPLASASADVVVSGLMLNFVPDAGLAMAEMTRVARAGGTVALYVWDYAGEMQLIRQFWDAAAALDARAIPLDEGRRFPICHPQALEELFRATGLQRVQSQAIDVLTRFHDFSDYWQPFLGGQGPAPGYAMSLDEDKRGQLRDRLHAQLPRAQDGSIELVARAWAVCGTRA
jgi:SAM-dependent methyltransferase